MSGGGRSSSVSLTFSALPLFLFTVLRGVPSIIALFFAGLLLLCTTPVTLAAMQELLPHDRATGAGLAITAEYTVSALGTILIGLIADHVGLPHVIQVLTLIPLLGIPLAILLARDTRIRDGVVRASAVTATRRTSFRFVGAVPRTALPCHRHHTCCTSTP